MLIRLGQMILNVVTVSLTAKFFGISMERDMWLYTNTLILTITGMSWGPVNEVFRAKFIFIKEEEGEEKALICTRALFNFIIIMALVIGTLFGVFSHHISDLFVEDTASREVFWRLFLLLIPTLLIRELTMLCTSLLNAYNVFYIPEYANLFSGLVNIVLLILLAPLIGIYSLMVSCYFSLTVLLVAVVYFIKKRKIKLLGYGSKLNIKLMMPFLLFALPLYLPYFVGQLNEIVQNALASSLGSGTISTLGYSKQFLVIVQGIMASVIATVMMPVLAKAFKNNNSQDYIRILNENALLYMTIYGAFACAAIGAASPVCRLLFQYGKMSMEDVEHVIVLTRLFTTAFLGVVLYMLFSICLLTTGRNKIYALIGTFTQGVVLLLNLGMVGYLEVYVFPLSYGLAHILAGLFMFYVFKMDGKYLVGLTIIRCLVSIAVCVGVFYLLNSLMDSRSLLLQIIGNIALAFIIIPGMLLMMGVDVRHYFLMLAKRVNGIG